MEEPCEKCIVGMICSEPCSDIIGYVKKDSRSYLNKDSGCTVCGDEQFYKITNLKRFREVHVCSKCDMSYVWRY